MGLKWNGSGYLPDVPARDLTDEEAEQYGGKEALIASGVYYEEKMSKPERENKMQRPSEENK